jgi:signal transduction histidine kinase
MNRPAHIWIAFAFCLAVVLGAMGWVSVTVLRLERTEEQAQRQAEREENTRLALWRMDSAIAPIVAAENARPYFVYRSYYPLDKTFGNMFNGNAGGDILMPSPLLTQPSPFILLHFQLDPDGTLTSPQVPGKEPPAVAEHLNTLRENVEASTARMKELQSFVHSDSLLAVLPAEELPVNAPIRLTTTKSGNNDVAQKELATEQSEGNKTPVTKGETPPVKPVATDNDVAANSNDRGQGQAYNNVFDNNNRGQQGAVKGQQEDAFTWQARRTSTEQSYRQRNVGNRVESDKNSQNKLKQQQIVQILNDAQVQCATNAANPNMPVQQPGNTPQHAQTEKSQTAFLLPQQQMALPNFNIINPNFLNVSDLLSHVSEGATVPVWLNDKLILARRCAVNNQLYIQGCWLDWPGLQSMLLGEIGDLLPSAQLEAVATRSDDKQAYMLAALPIRLVPGIVPTEAAAAWTPMRLSLLIAWGCVLLAAGAVAALLLGAVSLSERRGAFVSSVTHELRTPLTTFRLYTEMLSGGMVPDEAQRQKYLNTLHVEAERLSHLVENVLAYARLERGRPGSRLDAVPVSTLLEKASARLADRVAQAGMKLRVEPLTPGIAALTVRTDPSAVEQIVFNLVDNACKYAVGKEKPEIHVQLAQGNSAVELRVRDQGPGLTQKDARNLFQPFSKSAREAAHSAPGVGLGLALSRRLAREMGGDLKLDPSVTDGACFVLTMPMVQS